MIKQFLKITLGLLFIASIYQSANGQANNIDALLSELPDVEFTKILTPEGFIAAYELRVKQPIDHNDPTKGHFFQRAFLSHRSINVPTVMVTEGYTATRNRINELTELVNGNQIIIEHRYFGKSRPDTLDYNYLTIPQLTTDLHHINSLLKQIYIGKWLATGRSKGGATTLFYRNLYPNDVDVSVNYVGPINKTFEEQRIYHFLDTVGTLECRANIESFQRYLLKNRKHILPLLEAYNLGAKATFNYFTLAEAFELAVLEYPFSFWQYGYSCDDIPKKPATYFEAVSYFLSISDIRFFSDESINRLASHYYQSANEMGYYAFETTKFNKLIKELPTDHNVHAAFTPNKMSAPFDDTYLNQINAWLPEHGDKIIHIYGTLDTWSASAVPPSDKVDALWFFMNGKHHANALISTMTPKEKAKLVSALERWLDISIE